MAEAEEERAQQDGFGLGLADQTTDGMEDGLEKNERTDARNPDTVEGAEGAEGAGENVGKKQSEDRIQSDEDAGTPPSPSEPSQDLGSVSSSILAENAGHFVCSPAAVMKPEFVDQKEKEGGERERELVKPGPQ